MEPVLAAHQAGLEARIRDLAQTVETIRTLRRAGSGPTGGPTVTFDLPGLGRRAFELRDIPAITYITGPLGSGKTRLARRWPRLSRAESSSASSAQTDGLLAALETRIRRRSWSTMVEQGLDTPNQRTLIGALRRRGLRARLLFLMTRSWRSSISRSRLGRDDPLLPRQPQPPIRVAPLPGAPGYEAVATCSLRPRCGRARPASSPPK
jgi:hypothetical protein